MMLLRTMLLISLGFFVESSVAATPSTATARTVLTKIEQAYSNRNAASLLQLIHADAKISLKAYDGGKPHIFTPSKITYVRQIEQGWKAAAVYRYEMKISEVKIVGPAVVAKVESKESVLVRGIYYDVTTSFTYTLEDFGKQTQITEIQSTSSTRKRH